VAHYRAQISWQCDSAFPRDAITINPHYNCDDAQALADVLKSNMLGFAQIGPSVPFSVKVYDALKAPPSYPLAEARNDAAPKVTTLPRELALCLSYYATVNRPSFRGRLYIPAFIIGGGVSLRPTPAQQDVVISMRNVLNFGLPPGTIWEVWSHKNKSGAGISHVWCDDEWDIIRSRGLKGVTRVQAPAAP